MPSCLSAVRPERRHRSESGIGSLERGPRAQAQIFANRVGQPAAGLFNAAAPPNAAGAVEFGEHIGPMAHGLLHGKMFVQGDGLRGRQRRIASIEMAPAGLNHAQFRFVEEMGDGLAQKVGIGLEIGVKNGDEFAAGLGEGSGQRARFVPFAAVAVQQGDVDAFLIDNAAPT